MLGILHSRISEVNKFGIIDIFVITQKQECPTSYLCYMDVGLAIGCHAGYQNVSRCRTRGESEDHTSEKTHKGSTLHLKPKADVTRSPRQGYQWPHKKDLCHPKILNEKIDIFCNRINSETRMPLCRCM